MAANLALPLDAPDLTLAALAELTDRAQALGATPDTAVRLTELDGATVLLVEVAARVQRLPPTPVPQRATPAKRRGRSTRRRTADA